jgi:hypothetical protein
MPDYEPIDYRLRCHSKRTNLPPDVLRDICEAYETIQRLTKERDEARREVSFLRPSVCLGAQTAHEYAEARGWDCFKEDGK